jgi:hypothetical protein
VDWLEEFWFKFEEDGPGNEEDELVDEELG